MQIIKLNATNSTNEHLKRLLLEENIENFTVVVAEKQLKGRGQMGAEWLSEYGKNLTFSVLCKNNYLEVKDQFRLNMCVSLAIYKALSGLGIQGLSVKWPNDILSANSKICGILIENILSGRKIQSSIIGIGLNVNQVSFTNLPNVSSLKLLKGVTFNLDEVLNLILESLKKCVVIDFLQNGSLAKQYEEVLFRRHKPSTFKNSNDEFFMGFIQGISSSGKLIVMLEDNLLKEFDLKEIRLLY